MVDLTISERSNRSKGYKLSRIRNKKIQGKREHGELAEKRSERERYRQLKERRRLKWKENVGLRKKGLERGNKKVRGQETSLRILPIIFFKTWVKNKFLTDLSKTCLLSRGTHLKVLKNNAIYNGSMEWCSLFYTDWEGYFVQNRWGVGCSPPSLSYGFAIRVEID